MDKMQMFAQLDKKKEHFFKASDAIWEHPETSFEERFAADLLCGLLREKGFAIGNVDATVIAQRPKLAPFISSMREKLAKACGIPTAQVSVKATTEEGLGFTGAGEGIAASAVCLLH